MSYANDGTAGAVVTVGQTSVGSAVVNHAAAWVMEHPPKLLRGMGYGLDLPSLRVSLRGRTLDLTARRIWLEFICGLHPALASIAERSELASTDAAMFDDWPGTINWLLSAWHCIQDMLGAPASARGRIVDLTEGRAICAIPVITPAALAMQGVLQGSVWTLSMLPGSAYTDSQERAALKRVLALLEVVSKTQSNTPMFLAAARRMGLPMLELPGSLWQFGTGRRARWLESSYTDTTPVMAHKLSKRKDHAAIMLTDAGIPVPQHCLVRDSDDAVRIAETFGYPVVVKPADQDGGRGVFADLCSPDQVRKAYTESARLSTKILVERHIKGRDYRLVVFQGRVTFAVERIAASVTGDGTNTIAELLLRRNALARAMRPPSAEVALDEEALRMLDREGLSPASVPASGQWVRLRSIANYAVGGTVVAVTDQVHPDNARLAVRAAEAVRLDLAGIDLLMPDIATSWHDVGAAVCEVNGQPNLGRNTSAHLYGDILQALVPGNGRVPTVIALGGAVVVQTLMEQVARGLAEHGLVVGMAGPKGVCIGDEQICHDRVVAAHGARVLALDRRVDAIVVGLSDDSVLRQGLPFARFDWLLLADTPNMKDARELPRQQIVDEFLSLLLPACDGVVFCGEPYLRLMDGSRWHTNARFQKRLPSGQWLVEELDKLLLHRRVSKFVNPVKGEG